MVEGKCDKNDESSRVRIYVRVDNYIVSKKKKKSQRKSNYILRMKVKFYLNSTY